MATILKTEEEIEILRESGRCLSRALDAVEEAVAPGVSTKDLDDVARDFVRGEGDEPAFLGYQPDGAARPFPASLCVSVNDEVVHGIPRSDHILKNGDIVSLDYGVNHRGMITDSARTVAVGEIGGDLKELLAATEMSLEEGISVVRPGAHIGDIGFAIESYVKPMGYGIVRELGGHSVGKHVHEPPYIGNVGKRGTGEKIRKGMVLAIEPMLNLGNRFITMDADGWTIRTADGKRSAHFEHTVLVTDDGAEVVTVSE